VKNTTPKYWVFSVTGAVTPQLMLLVFHVFSTHLICGPFVLCVPAGLIHAFILRGFIEGADGIFTGG